MNYNNTAFSGINDMKYRNWDGYTLVYSYDFLKYIEEYIDLNEIHTVFDIGSRDACQALEFSDWFPNSKVYLFEPVPSSYQYCVENTNGRDNIICNNIALADFDGDTTFYQVVNGNVGASSLLKVTPMYSHYEQQPIDVKVKTAKTFIEENGIKSVDLLWVDVQGSEINCFKGFERHLQNVKAIHTEVGLNAYYQNGTEYYELCKFMEENGFELIKVLHNEAGLEVDVIFVNKKYKK
jgi:FkbM family methyltransferase